MLNNSSVILLIKSVLCCRLFSVVKDERICCEKYAEGKMNLIYIKFSFEIGFTNTREKILNEFNFRYKHGCLHERKIILL